MRELGEIARRGTMCQIKHSLSPFSFPGRSFALHFFASHHLVLWWPRCGGCCGALLNGLLLPGSMQTMTAIIMGFETSLENDQLSRVGALLLVPGELPKGSKGCV